MNQTADYKINDIHPNYGKCVAMGCKDGEAYRMFTKDGVVSLIPCRFLNTQHLKEIMA